MVYELRPKYDARKSFYGKAIIDEYNLVEENNNVVIKELYSYGTLVGRIGEYIKENVIIYKYLGKYSQTTTRHQKEFFKQHGLSDDEIKKLFKDGTLEVHNG